MAQLKFFRKIDGLKYGFTINPVTRRIRFQYDATRDMAFDFGLLCEVGEWWQGPMKQLLAENGISLEIYNGPDDYCNLARFIENPQ